MEIFQQTEANQPIGSKYHVFLPERNAALDWDRPLDQSVRIRSLGAIPNPEHCLTHFSLACSSSLRSSAHALLVSFIGLKHLVKMAIFFYPLPAAGKRTLWKSVYTRPCKAQGRRRAVVAIPILTRRHIRSMLFDAVRATPKYGKYGWRRDAPHL